MVEVRKGKKEEKGEGKTGAECGKEGKRIGKRGGWWEEPDIM